ncbi:MAG: glycosyltransferase family 39 protein [Candidatus Eisenbacteria bacterium]
MSGGFRSGALLGLVLGLLLLRLVTLGAAPLFDQTEGRYGEIGREMAAGGDWITPTLHGGEPFWGKPPLHFWMTAASIRLFGANEWAARLPGYLASLGLLLLTARAGGAAGGRDAALLAAALLGSSALFVLLAGAVLLDATFTFAVTGALVSLYVAPGGRRPSAWWGYGFFLFAALGLLAKGPVALVLIGAPVVLEGALTKSVRRVRGLPWFPGALVFVAVAAPWFVLAERKTPGFLDYFFFHEHLLRFLRKEYGDLYGHGHVSPYGMVWLLGFAAFLPWTPALLGLARRSWRRRVDPEGGEGGRFLWLWALSPLLFFTFSRSLSLPYVYPALPPLTVLLAREYAGPEGGERTPRWSPPFAAALLVAGVFIARREFGLGTEETARLVALPALLLALAAVAAARGGRTFRFVAAVLVFPVAVLAVAVDTPRPLAERNSTRALARAATAVSGREGAVFFEGVPPSAEFYFRGRVTDLKGNGNGIDGACAGGVPLLVREDRLDRLPAGTAARADSIGRMGRYRIFLVRPRPGAVPGRGGAPEGGEKAPEDDGR